MTDFGPHLLGRVPSTPDERDFRMSAILGSGADPYAALDIALASVQKSYTTSHAVKNWAKLVTQIIKSQQPAPAPAPSPDPTPTPDPTPSPTPTPSVVEQWKDADQLDQGQTGHCVGFGWCQWGNTDPVNDNYSDDDGHKLYYECKVIDGEPNQEDGSSVRSGAKAMKARGRIDAYVFASSMADIKAWVQTKGPVVVGTDWMSDMFDPDANGVVKPTGSVAGGHCYILVGWKNDMLTFQNSWGNSWGVNGYFHMHAADFATLMANQGEACAGLELAI